MAKQDIKGKAQTVLGLVDGDELGITLPHEHLFIDQRTYLREPSDPEGKRLAHKKITLKNLSYARYHKFNSEDNLVLDDEEVAIRETMYFKEAGGKTIVDMSCINIGRNPRGLVNVAKATGLNIIMGTAYYIGQSYTPEMKIDSRTEEDIAEDFIRDIRVGIEHTGIKAGIIGEAGFSWPLEKGEEKVLRAVGIASEETGSAINIHPGALTIEQNAPFEYIRVLKDVGASPNRVVFSHSSRTFPISARDTRARLAEMGCYLEYDMFGSDGIYPLPMSPYDVANDAIRLSIIMELIEDGFLNRILISQDVCMKVQLRAYGGGGYSHILKNVVPKMQGKGMTEEQIHTILADNPRRINTFV